MAKGSTTEKILLEFYPEAKNILPAIKNVSAAFGYVSEPDAEKIADYFSVPLSKIYETASFYDEIKITRQPDLIIQVCSGTNCTVGDAFGVIREIESIFGIKAGDEYGQKIKLEIISCLGRCGEGPIVVANGEVFTNVTPSGVHGILSKWI